MELTTRIHNTTMIHKLQLTLFDEVKNGMQASEIVKI